jgi:hypothetical protein
MVRKVAIGRSEWSNEKRVILVCCLLNIHDNTYNNLDLMLYLLQLNLTTGIFENNELFLKITELLFSKMTA